MVESAAGITYRALCHGGASSSRLKRAGAPARTHRPEGIAPLSLVGTRFPVGPRSLNFHAMLKSLRSP